MVITGTEEHGMNGHHWDRGTWYEWPSLGLEHCMNGHHWTEERGMNGHHWDRGTWYE